MSLESTAEKNFQVAIFAPANDPHALAEIFREQLGLHPTDAMIWARHIPGLLNQHFTAQQAEALTRAIVELGVQAHAFPVDQVPNLRHAETVHHVRCEAAGLQVFDLHGNADVLIPWSAIQTICVGEIPFETTRRFASGDWTAVSAGHHVQRPEMTVPLTPSYEAWITCQPPFQNLRIEHERMNYEYLGDDLSDSSATNFHRLILDLTKSAPGALLTESTKSFMNHEHPQHYRFASAENLLQLATIYGALGRANNSSA